MQPAPLRPLPSRPPDSIAPAEALRFAGRELSGLDEPAAQAFSLIALVGRSRQEVGSEIGVSGEELAAALARARKALRRKLYPLPGSGWCERAERLISDRIDGALQEPGPARLEAHLTNCSRCVEHERRLAQAQDALVTGFLEEPSTEAPAGDELRAQVIEGPAPLSVLQTYPLPAPAIARLTVQASAVRVVESDEALAGAEARPAEIVMPSVPAAPITPAPERTTAPARLPQQVAQPSAWLPAASTPRAPALPYYAPAARPAARPLPTRRVALEAESTWTMVGPLVVVLTLAAMVFVLAAVLATGA